MKITRRTFLKTVVVSAGTLAAAGPLALGTANAGGTQRRYFPFSVASGDPKPDSVVLWTHLADDRLLEGTPSLPLRLQVATSEAFDDLVVDVVVDAFAANDGCVRVKVTGLTPRTYYYYRFLARTPGFREVVSRHGRTRTAPASNDPVPVRFALASCQDYIGKYYNAYLPLLTTEYDDLDFLLHVGDFIYETTGDPDFQGGGDQRNLTFEDEAGAIAFRDEQGRVSYLAARSLSNYRDLHRTYRSDPVLQEILEKFPLVHIWDDHEFTDDSWQDHSTYFGGRGTLPDNGSIKEGDGSQNPLELETERRLNAEQAFLEYIPIDDEDLTLPPGAASSAIAEVRDILDKGADKLFPDFRFFRTLRFGQILNLILTDYRSYRPNHPMDEDAFPGSVRYGEDAIRAKYDEAFGDEGATRFKNDRRLFKKLDPLLGPVVVDLENGNPSGFREYIAWTALSRQQRLALRDQLAVDYEAGGFSPDAASDKAAEVLAGDLDIEYLNGILDAYNRRMGTGVPGVPRNIELPRGAQPNPYGLSNYGLHKILLLGDIGARYALNPEWHDLWRALRADEVGGRPPEEDAYGQDGFGTEQETWLAAALEASETTWNIVASSVSSSAIIIDLENEELLPPDGSLPDSGIGEVNWQVETLRRLLALVVKILGLGTRFYVTCDQWDGMPNTRYMLHRLYREKGNVILVSGDIHSSWINDFSTNEGKLFEFTGTSISSATFSGVLSGLLPGQAAATPERPAGPALGLARALRQAIEAGALTLDPRQLEAAVDPATLAELEGLAAQAFGAELGTASGTAGADTSALSDLFERLLALLDLYFFDFTHESPYLIDADGESKIKSDLVGIDSGSNGVVVIDVAADSVRATYLLVDPADVAQSYYGRSERNNFLLAKVKRRYFEVKNGSLVEL